MYSSPQKKRRLLDSPGSTDSTIPGTPQSVPPLTQVGSKTAHLREIFGSGMSTQSSEPLSEQQLSVMGGGGQNLRWPGAGPPNYVDPVTYAYLKKKFSKKRKKAKSSSSRTRLPRASFTSRGSLTQVVGGGGYRELLKAAAGAIPSGTFDKYGGIAGRYIGDKYGVADLGEQAGSLIGRGISSLSGFGAYNVSANSLMVGEGAAIPEVRNFGGHATVIRHREFIQDVTAPSSPLVFNNSAFSINPGLSSTFPWLASIAAGYDQYQVVGMIFEFISLSGDVTSTGAQGSVIMATNYDTANSNYASKQQMENGQYSVSTKPSASLIHAVECDPTLTSDPIRYIRTSAVPSGKDQRLYDLGNFQLATVGLAATAGQVIGELWVSYEIAFLKPSMLGLSLTTQMDRFSLSATGGGAGLYFGTVNQVPQAGGTGSNLGGTIVVTSDTYLFPANISSGKYLIQGVWTGGSGGVTTALSFTLTNCTATTGGFNNNSTNASAQAAGLTTVRNQASFYLTVTAANASITVNAGTVPQPSKVDFLVIQVPSGIVT